MSPAKEPFRLLDLATELQDLIDEFYFSSNLVFVVSEANPNPPYLEALRTRNDQEKYESAKATCYKHATFKVREEHLKVFLDNAKPYTRHIKEIRLESDRLGITIDKNFTPRSAWTPSYSDQLASLILREGTKAMANGVGMKLKKMEQELHETGLQPSTLKIAIKVMDGKKLIWKKWTDDCDVTIRTAMVHAEYS